MKKFSFYALTLALFVLPLTANLSPLLAQDLGYIDDVLYVPVRSGDGNQYRIVHKGLKSGTELKILEINSDNTWTRILTSSNIEGWIPNQFISKTKTANLLVESLKAQTKSAKERAKSLEEKYTQTNAQLKRLENIQKQGSDENNNLTLELQKIKSISSSAIEMDRNYQTLLEQHELLKTKYDSLFAENENLKADQRLSFFLYGAGLIVLGMFLMLILPHLKPRQSFSEWR